MEIKEDVIAKLIEVWKKKRGQILKGELKGFTIYRTEKGEKVVTTQLKNVTGWYAIVCYYECFDVVEVYDMHVFDRYQERFKAKDSIVTFIRRGNVEGTLLVKDYDGRTEKKVRDGAVLGRLKGNIVYHKTYITDEMISENKMDYLFELCE
jgi:hypothetical protein